MARACLGLFALAVACGSPPQSAAQKPEPRMELAAMRAAAELRLARAFLPLLRKQAVDLLSLERQLAGSGDFEGAIAARNERQAVEKEASRLEKEELVLRSREQGIKSAMLPDEIVLMPDQAVLKGVAREPGTGALINWKKPGDSATWKLPGLPPGGYEIVLRCSCSFSEGGSVVLREQSFTLGGSVDPLAQNPAEKNLGTLKITNGAGTLALEARTVDKDNLMRLHYIKLLPASR